MESCPQLLIDNDELLLILVILIDGEVEIGVFQQSLRDFYVLVVRLCQQILIDFGGWLLLSKTFSLLWILIYISVLLPFVKAS